MTGMLKVAEHLSSQAKAHTGDDADAFGRSAFNRYYYASYLSVRDLLSMLDSGWEAQPHKQIPDLLEGAVIQRVRKQVKQLAKSGLLNVSRERTLARLANQASSDIAAVLRAAYGVRVAADYEPRQRVVFHYNRFSLLEHTSEEASKWKARVDRAKGALLGIFREIGLV